jgi:hypothetical protein
MSLVIEGRRATMKRATAKYRKTAKGKAVKAKMAYKYVAKKRAVVSALKAEPCSDCGGRFPPECMDFDHVRGQKAAIVSQLCVGDMAVLLAEIAKCDLVCSNCHRIRTKLRRKRLE